MKPKTKLKQTDARVKKDEEEIAMPLQADRGRQSPSGSVSG